MAFGPPRPPPSGALNGKTRNLRGFVFVDSAPPLDREEGAVETAALLRRVHYAKFWRSSGAATSFQAATARHASRVESLRSSLFDRHARNFRQKLAHAQIPHLRLKFELHYGGGR